MKLANESAAGLWAPLPPGLDGLIARLEALSLSPMFQAQRDLALRQALRPYVEGGGVAPLPPYAQEVELAAWTVYADYYPQDGQLTLIEQLRDVITEHIPEEERAWMDPLKHSYLDLTEIVPSETPNTVFACRSLGDRRVYQVRGGDISQPVQPGQVLLTRFVQMPGDPETNDVVIGGCALLLTAAEGRILLEAVNGYRREMEINAGSFELGDWHEFAKRFGHMLLWIYAQMRLGTLLKVVADIRYGTADGARHLYALALYEHRELALLRDRLAGFEGMDADPPGGSGETLRWILRGASAEDQGSVVARFTLTPTQLWVEADSRERLDALKHQLAAAFGFSLHFRGEATDPAPHRLSADELNADQPVQVVVTPDQDEALLHAFLETAYLDWSDREAPVLGGKTPRHAATTPAGREHVGRVIDEMERSDLGWRRIGKPAFDYNVLRGHVGLEEVRREDAPAERSR
ncbi:MAG: hypothetical protein RI101_09110 [Nitrospira sp.]|jgi:hypothetical protein|nr:hypothetical protein [Nitrospira sp.]